MVAQPIRPATPQTKRIIGREKEQRAIQEAIEGRETCALYFVGEAGIGKTRQLREPRRWYAAQQEGDSPLSVAFEWLELVDLYHSDLHTPSVIERHIVERIDPDFERHPEQSPFEAYLVLRKQFEERRRQGLVSEKERAELTRTFESDYNGWAMEHRAVIAFDTLELIVYEADAVIETCEGEAGSADVKGWMLEVLPQLQNTVILLASRPHEQLEAEFRRQFDKTDVCYQEFTLTRLNEDDTEAYFSDILAQRPDIHEKFEGVEPAESAIHQQIWHYTRGVPILMSLVIDLVAFGNVGALQKLRDIPDPVDSLEVRKLLVNELRQVEPPIWETLRCLAVARRGLTPELFQRLMADPSWSLKRCRQELGRLRGAAFVKAREGSEALFLHDALYEMLDELKPFPLMDPGRLLPIIIKHYEEEANAAAEDVKGVQEELRQLDLRVRAGVVDEEEVEAQRQSLTEELTEREQMWHRLRVELVFYKLWYDPLDGFEFYARMYNSALKGHEFGFEARLHDEILRYTKSPLYTEDEEAQKRLPPRRFLRHCALRWIKFHLARSANEQAARVARRVRDADEAPLGGPEAEKDGLYQAELWLWGGEGLLYQGREEAKEWLEEALVILERAETQTARTYDRWRWNRLVGRAHNDLAYIAHKEQRYTTSVRESRAAIPRFREADVLDEQANTLNNLGYVYSVLGHEARAKSLAEDARQLRERLGQLYPLALSYNTTAEIHTASNEPEEALAWADRSRELFTAMEDPRGLGLSYIASGRANRKIGDKGKRGQYPFEKAEHAFRQALEWLEKALEIFDGDTPKVDEPYRLWEALNELGASYVDWAYLFAWHGLPEQADEKYAVSVDYQKQAAEVAERHGFELQRLDSFDDLAQAYADWGKLEEAKGYLQQIYRTVPEEYRLVEGQGFREFSDPVDGYWLILGKYYLQRGIWVYRMAESAPDAQEKDELLDEAVDYFARALAYFRRFSPAQAALDITTRAMYRRFRSLNLSRLKHLREKVEGIAKRYKVDLSRLIETLDDALGIV